MTSSNYGHESDTPAAVISAFRDNPEAYIARDLRQALADGHELPDRVQGSALFADISGFTQLTEALRDELGPQRGAETLTAHLDRAFHALIGEFDRYGGNVIYFSGDAITGWIDGDDGRRAVAAALAIQSAMAEAGRITTPAGTTIQLTIKVAIATGAARRFIVGDPRIQKIDVLAGSLLDELATAEAATGSGEILINAAALESLGDRLVLSEQRLEEASGRSFGVVERLTIQIPQSPVTEPPPLDAEIVRQWLLPVVYERISTGRGEFLAELRPAFPVFVRFGGIDFDADDDAITKLDGFVAGVQQIFDRYGGNLLQLTLGDKGAYLYGVFGSPIAHEEDATRAAAAALKILDLEKNSSVRGLQIGIAHGALRSGTYGHAMRRTFVCLGDAVNLAARLMSAAPSGTIYVSDDVRTAAGDGFVWEQLSPLEIKGKAEPVAACTLTGSLAGISRRRTRYELPIVGRGTELQYLDQTLAEARSGHGRIMAISAEAGMGKSRLVAEFVREARRMGVLVAFGECQSIAVNSSYSVWIEIWRRLLGVEDEDNPEQQRYAAETALRNIDPGLVPRAPLLSDVLGLTIPDSELTRSFDAKLRKSSLQDLLAICLRDRSAGEPLVLVLEDCHWIDDLSRELLETLVRATATHRVLILLAYRPATKPGGGLGLEQLAHFQELPLDELGPADTRDIIISKAEQIFGSDELPDSFVDLVVTRSEGNPFHAEEILNYVAGKKIRPGDEAALRNIELPESMHSLVLSRIDSLEENPRRTLKVASVIGRLFRANTLASVYPELGRLPQLIERLDDLRDEDLITLDQAEALSYLFRHAVTQEVSYNSMPFAIRAGLHRRVGEFVEQTEGEDLEPHLDLLAHHFWNSDDDTKKRQYLTRAEASARARYANEAAIDYGERLVSLVEGIERAEALLNLAKVHELTGNWQQAEAVIADADGIALDIKDEVLNARCETALAEVSRKQGRFDEAVELLASAAATFREQGDDAGLGLALHVSGTVSAQKGNYDNAARAYQESLTIREALGDRAAVASLHSNLAIVAEYSSDYPGARAACEQALAIRREIGDRWGIGISQNNIGLISILEKDYVEARSRLEEAMRICQEVGDSWMVTLVQNNLGNANRELGEFDAARSHYAASLEGYRTFDDQWGLTFLLEDTALFALRSGKPLIALELLGAADARHESSGSPRSPAHETELQEKFKEARAALGDSKVDEIRERGRSHSMESAIEFALSFTHA